MADKWSPPNLQDLSQRLATDPNGAGRDVDQAVQIAFKKLNALPTSVVSEVPRGLVNGTNTTYILAHTPSGTVAVYADGARTTSFRISGTTITMVTAPSTSLIVDYSYV